MLSKLANGLSGTWESLDPQERILVLYGAIFLGIVLARVLGQPAREGRLQKEREAFADLVAERIKK